VVGGVTLPRPPESSDGEFPGDLLPSILGDNESLSATAGRFQNLPTGKTLDLFDKTLEFPGHILPPSRGIRITTNLYPLFLTENIAY